jgi:hypothetical protein
MKNLVMKSPWVVAHAVSLVIDQTLWTRLYVDWAWHWAALQEFSGVEFVWMQITAVRKIGFGTWIDNF